MRTITIRIDSDETREITIDEAVQRLIEDPTPRGYTESLRRNVINLRKLVSAILATLPEETLREILELEPTDESPIQSSQE